jgi:hypothetical protein
MEKKEQKGKGDSDSAVLIQSSAKIKVGARPYYRLLRSNFEYAAGSFLFHYFFKYRSSSKSLLENHPVFGSCAGHNILHHLLCRRQCGFEIAG